MTQYLVAIHYPDKYEPSREDEAMHRDIDALNEEMAACARQAVRCRCEHSPR